MGSNSQPDRSAPWAAARTYQQGLAAFETRRYDEAIELLSQVSGTRSLPGTLADYYLGQAHLHQGTRELAAQRYESAARHLTEARRLNPESAGLTRYLTAAFVGQRRFDLAAREIEKTQDRPDADDMTSIRLAHALARDGQNERAISTLETAIRDEPARADLRFQLGVLLGSTDDLGAATIALQQAAKLAPDDIDIRRQLGLTLGAQDRPGDAARELAIAQRLQPANAHIALLLSLAAQAAELAGAPADITPATITATRDDQVAIDALGELVATEPDFVEAFLDLPDSRVDRHVFAMLARTLERALERYPEYADLHHHCSRVYARLGRTDDAIAAARHAIDVNPRYVQALIQLARLYGETHQGAEAIDRLTEAVAAGGDYPDVHFMLAELHRDSGDERQACVEYVRALRRNANYTAAKEALHEWVGI